MIEDVALIQAKKFSETPSRENLSTKKYFSLNLIQSNSKREKNKEGKNSRKRSEIAI